MAASQKRVSFNGWPPCGVYYNNFLGYELQKVHNQIEFVSHEVNGFSNNTTKQIPSSLTKVYRKNNAKFSKNDERSSRDLSRPQRNIYPNQSSLLNLLFDIHDGGKSPAKLFPDNHSSGDDNGILNQNLLRLHQEIVNFVKMAGTQQDNAIRNKVIARVSNVVDHLWPESRVELFGSFRTGLHLPGSSDIDLVIIRKSIDVQQPAYQKFTDLKEALVKWDVADADSVIIVDKTVVPLVKLTDKWTDVKMDIIFKENGTIGGNGVQASALIKKICQKFPEISTLVFVIKHLMLQNDKNEVYKGGISSYSVILMLYSLFQAHRVSNTINVNDPLGLGSWLLLFFGFYGTTFNFDQYGIRVKALWPYFERPQIMNIYGDYPPPPLCIEDPCTPGNDIGRGSYGIKIVQDIFAHAYKQLCTAVRSEANDSTCFLDVILKDAGRRRMKPLVEEEEDLMDLSDIGSVKLEL